VGYFAKADLEVVRGDDFTITQVWSLSGAAVNISSWVFAFEANEISTRAATPGNITVANSAMVKSASSSVVDTLSIPLSDTDTDVTEGRYKYDIKATVGSDEVTVFRGTLTVLPSEQD